MHTLKVGDVLSSSWGYEQTNVTFYQVTRVTPSSVELGVVRSVETSDGPLTMTGTKTPLRGEFVNGNRWLKRVSASGQVKLSSCEYAHLWDGKPQRFSSYA
jgi:hypothetical protein